VYIESFFLSRVWKRGEKDTRQHFTIMLSAGLSAAVVLFVVYFSLTLVQAKYRHYRQARDLKCQKPNRVKAPFFGMASLWRSYKAKQDNRLLEEIGNTHAEYGYTFAQSSPIHAFTVTIEPENVKAILATKFSDFGLGTRNQQFYPLLGDGIFTLDGAGWTHSRALLRPQFARDQVSIIIIVWW
jgi:cytochrome P450